MIIIFLILFGVFIFRVTKIYEERLISFNNAEVMNNYMPFKRCKNFKSFNSERYVRFYENNNDLSYQDVVNYVNIGLDYNFYDYISNADISKNYLILVNKYNKLSYDYVPKDLEKIDSKYFINGNTNARFLRKDAKEAFEKLSSDSILNNTPVYGQSGYRSYERQDVLYNNAVFKNGKAYADNDTARAGHSEHQTGLTIDVSSNKDGNMLSFENTSSFNWMMDNAYKYGFILRYPKGKEKVHGFIYEAWHYRYVGEKVAKDMHDNYSDLTYEEYYYMFLDK